MGRLALFPVSERGTKVCAICHAEKSVGDFDIKDERLGTPFANCRVCQLEYMRQAQALYRQRHPVGADALEQRRAEDRARYAADPEPFREMERRRRVEKPAHIRVVRHHRYVKNREKIYAAAHRRRCLERNAGTWTAAEWEAIKTLQAYKCLMCKRAEPEIKLTRDHVIPVTRGGANTAANLQGLCRPCNAKKARRHLDLRKLTQASLL